jgi:integrase
MVLAYTGIPNAQIAMIAPTDVDLHARNVAVHGRKKGKGTPGRIVPLTPDGVRAFQMMAREEAWGKFSRATLRNMFRRACKRALGRDDFTPTDLRHSYGTEMYRVSGDIRATQVLMGHSTPQLTHRYTLAAVDPRVAAAIAKWHRSPKKDAR